MQVDQLCVTGGAALQIVEYSECIWFINAVQWTVDQYSALQHNAGGSAVCDRRRGGCSCRCSRAAAPARPPLSPHQLTAKAGAPPTAAAEQQFRENFVTATLNCDSEEEEQKGAAAPASTGTSTSSPVNSGWLVGRAGKNLESENRDRKRVSWNLRRK